MNINHHKGIPSVPNLEESKVDCHLQFGSFSERGLLHLFEHKHDLASFWHGVVEIPCNTETLLQLNDRLAACSGIPECGVLLEDGRNGAAVLHVIQQSWNSDGGECVLVAVSGMGSLLEKE